MDDSTCIPVLEVAEQRDGHGVVAVGASQPAELRQYREQVQQRLRGVLPRTVTCRNDKGSGRALRLLVR